MIYLRFLGAKILRDQLQHITMVWVALVPGPAGAPLMLTLQLFETHLINDFQLLLKALPGSASPAAHRL